MTPQLDGVTPPTPFDNVQTLLVPLPPGPFSPPSDYQFEEELLGPTPRPIPRAMRRGPVAALRRSVTLSLLVFGIIVLCLLSIPSVEEWTVFLLGFGHPKWVGYVAIALWAILVVLTADRITGASAYRPIRDGSPLVARVLALVIAPSLKISKSGLFYSVFALIEYLHPVSGKLTRKEVSSWEFFALERRNYTTTVHVGDYATAICLPNSPDSSLTLYSFLGLMPGTGLIRRRRPLLPLRAALVIVVSVGFFLLVCAGQAASHFFTPVEFGNFEALVSVGTGFVVCFGLEVLVLTLYWRVCDRRTARLNSTAVAHGEPVELGLESDQRFTGLGGALMVIVALTAAVSAEAAACTINAVSDDSPPQFEEVEIIRTESGADDRMYRGFCIVYRQLHPRTSHRHDTSAEAVRAMQKSGAKTGIAEFHRGRFGWRWLKEIRPALPRAEQVL